MRKIISITAIVLLSQLFSSICVAQHITSKVILKYSFGTSFIQNSEFDEDRNFPTLYPNYQNNRSNLIGFDYIVHKRFGLGLNLKRHKFSNWSYPEFNTYAYSKTSITEISPVFTYFFNNKNALHEYSIVLRPIYSIIKTEDMYFPTDSIDSQENQNEIEGLVDSKYSSIGIAAEANYCYYFSNTTGIYLTLGYTYIKTESIYSFDESLNMYTISVGLKLNVAKNKLYRYE